MGHFLFWVFNSMELKKPLTYDEQIERLSSFHKLIVSDKDSAIRILKTVGYYRLSAYGIGLTKANNRDEYIDDISIEHLYNLYCFDCDLREIMTRAIEFLEIQLRTQIGYHLSLKYGSDGYIKKENFKEKYTKDGVLIHDKLIESFHKERERQKNTPFVKHHNEKYEGRFPLWVATELFSFGNITSMYDIMLDEDRKAISDQYDADPPHFNSWILSLLEIRNICAHFGRLYNTPLKQAPHLYKENTPYRMGKINKVFPVILVIKRMLGEGKEWNSFFVKLQAIMEKYDKYVKLSYINFPANWLEVLSY